MPSASGVYSLPAGYLAVTGATILASQHNPPLEDIAVALTGRLSRDGSAPMLGPLKGVAGTVSAPGYSFATDASTGFLKTTSGIGVVVGGTQVMEITASGVASGVRFLGELIPYSGGTAPALTVVPVGQTLSRTTYAALWTFAQNEIANGSTFYNNGNGSTTFGVADMRGRVIAASDPTGTVLSGGAVTIGSALGAQTHALTAAENGPHNHGVTDNGHQHNSGPAGFKVATTAINISTAGATPVLVDGGTTLNQLSTTINATGISINSAGSGTPHSIVQPTFICNHLLFAGA